MEMLRPIHLNTAPSSPIHYTSSSSSPPSTPKHFGNYYISAPTSPSQLSHFYRDFDDLLLSPSPPPPPTNLEAEFAFDVSGDFGNPSIVSADELFHGGVIKPMQQQLFGGALSPRRSKKDPNYLRENSRNKKERSPEHVRGRERTPLISSSSRRATRSLSPVRVSQFPWEESEYHQQYKDRSKPSSAVNAKSSVLTNSGTKGSRKWRFKDFFLFRSASEGRATDKKDPLRKYYTATTVRKSEEIKGGSSSGGSVSKRRGKVSAHEMHYTANRAVSEDMKKKTFLPYKQGILGRLAFNPTGHGFGFSRK